MGVGEELEVLADDKAFKKDVEIWSYETGNSFLAFEDINGYYVARIKRGAGFKGDKIWSLSDENLHLQQWSIWKNWVLFIKAMSLTAV